MRYINSILFALLCLLATSCAMSGRSDQYDAICYSPEYASGFEILGAEGAQSSIIVTKTPWQGADTTAVTMLFIQRNKESIPTDFNGQVLKGDAKRIVCMSSTHIAMLDAIGEAKRIVGVSGIDYVSNPTIQARRDSVADIGFDGNIDFERLVAIDADLVLLFGVNGASGMEGKLRELGIPFMYVGEYLEESPLGKAEWLVAISEIVGKREIGMKSFAAIPQRYNKLKSIADTASEHPKVMINTPYGDSWLMASASSYVARLISDAGGEYIYTQNKSNQSLPIDMEEAYKLVAISDIWLNVGQTASLEELQRSFPKFGDTKPVVKRQVWNCNLRINASGGNDYWESGVVRPDYVLQDLIMIFHPDLISEPFSYYKRLE